MTKRAFDIVAAGLGLLVLSPLLVLVAVLVKVDSEGPVLFTQERVGKRFRRFRIYKFRTMVRDADAKGRPITCGHDPRITRVGALLRRLKIDELPQLVNVLKGDMSLVGPRPEVPRYVELFRTEYQEILEIRPGITDLASIDYRDESAILGQSDDPEGEYVNRILPDKLRLARVYLRNCGLLYDLKLIAVTLFMLFTRGHWPRLRETATVPNGLRRP